MRTPKGNSYASTEAELHQLQRAAKLLPCPHCGRVGFLICHGFLRGYAERGQGLVVRGRRLFCSDRYRRRGCGRTFSIALADVVRGFSVRTGTLFAFLITVVGGASRKAAWERVAAGFSLTTGYRLWRRLQRAQAHIRTLLCRVRSPPDASSPEPLAQLLAHARRAFQSSPCPFASLQSHFRVPLLP